jgi:8-oxo-dGTP pyrophosphatase MutT (NUDIX family)
MEFEVLWTGKYIKIISPKDHPYEAVLEKDGVIIFPILNGQIGIRKEFCPPYFIKDKSGDKLYYTVISGQIDEGEDTSSTVMKELKEEAGISLHDFRILWSKENIPVAKITASRTNIVILEIIDYEPTAITGDGTEYEAASKTLWVTEQELEEIVKLSNTDLLLIGLFNIYKNLKII